MRFAWAFRAPCADMLIPTMSGKEKRGHGAGQGGANHNSLDRSP